MNAPVIVLAVLLVLPTTLIAQTEDRTLGKDETWALFDQLTGKPQKTWITAGTIRATHTEYRAPKTNNSTEVEARSRQALVAYQNDPDKPQRTAELQQEMIEAIPFNVRYEWLNEYTMTTTEVIRYDGERFSWEITVLSRTDSVQPNKDLAYNEMIDRFNLDWNGTRLFTWDGETYTTCSLPVNRVMVDAAGRIPHGVNGALTAGIIPWGQGLLTGEALRSAECTAVEKQVEGQNRVHLNLQWPSGTQGQFVLDCQRGQAPLSACVVGQDNAVVTTTFENHRWVADRWVPMEIDVERRDRRTDRLLGYDQWNITSIDAATPSGEAFAPQYQSDAVIQYSSPLSGAKTLLYEHSNLIDTDSLLAERLAVAAQGTRPQNCATASLGYLARQLGRPIGERPLAESLDARGNTSLYALMQLAKDQGLYSRVVKTDLDALGRLKTYRAILYIPAKNHFVVLAAMDNRDVWLIDLTARLFFYRVDAKAFTQMEWTEGVALLVSKQPIPTIPGLIDIPDARLRTMNGATGYSCTHFLRYGYVVLCDQVNWTCIGNYYIYWELYGCEVAPSGVCYRQLLESYRKSPCINDPWNPYGCTITDEWQVYYTLAACESSGP